jgi:penicillin G amidase
VAIPTLRVTDGGTIHSQRQQAYTQWVPMADPDRALAILPPGNSEDPRSPHRTSALEDWAESRLRPAPLSRESVLRNAESTRKIPGGPGGSQSRSHHRN